ncbi:twin-arginine translocation signal domain-containing protein [Nocardioides euryhalodurans]|uniref:Twin-arginine translocation signal domain-containing protein n=1 Tax=Nocardioides euryhalodurans TaxID=2518370 RepID=A0A4P7GKW9_9ACTN|nr:twin-arginine translocation signal domain-containing protein [Nocardioides euryhalodurans]QBR92748.1 twin-arginine translocation signal domain-containing protein [Nocardioides euryhalodurans]
MTDTSRRKFLAATGAGAVAGTVAAAGSAQAATPHADSAQESVVAYVPDHRRSELHVLVGEREVVVHDRDLVTRILNAAGGN